MTSNKDKKRLDLDVRQPNGIEFFRKNEDYGDSFYSGVPGQGEKSVADYLKKKRKQRKKKLATILFESLSINDLVDIYLVKTAT